jgi:hypothetical protein
MLPNPPYVVECQKCNALFWLVSAERVVVNTSNASQRDSLIAKIRKCEYATEPDEEGYYRAIEQNIAINKSDVKQLRLLAWQKSNDAMRIIEVKDSIPQFQFETSRNDNMLKLMSMLEPDNIDDTLIHAELLRELKRYIEALDILKALEDKIEASNKAKLIRNTDNTFRMSVEASSLSVYQASVLPVIRQLKELCRSRDYLVRELQ